MPHDDAHEVSTAAGVHQGEASLEIGGGKRLTIRKLAQVATHGSQTSVATILRPVPA